jgi:hypothetical protein
MTRKTSISKLGRSCFRFSRLLYVFLLSLVFGMALAGMVGAKGGYFDAAFIAMVSCVSLLAYSMVCFQLFLMPMVTPYKGNPYFDVEIGDSVVILRYPTVAIRYKKKHFRDLGNRLVLKFPYWCFRFFAEIPIE